MQKNKFKYDYDFQLISNRKRSSSRKDTDSYDYLLPIQHSNEFQLASPPFRNKISPSSTNNFPTVVSNPQYFKDQNINDSLHSSTTHEDPTTPLYEEPGFPFRDQNSLPSPDKNRLSCISNLSLNTYQTPPRESKSKTLVHGRVRQLSSRSSQQSLNMKSGGNCQNSPVTEFNSNSPRTPKSKYTFLNVKFLPF